MRLKVYIGKMKSIFNLKKISHKTNVRVSLKTKFMFNMFSKMQAVCMGSGPAEREYWEKQGWLDKKRPWKN